MLYTWIELQKTEIINIFLTTSNQYFQVTLLRSIMCKLCIHTLSIFYWNYQVFTKRENFISMTNFVTKITLTFFMFYFKYFIFVILTKYIMLRSYGEY